MISSSDIFWYVIAPYFAMGIKVSHAEISGVSNVDILQLPEHLQVYTDTLIGSVYNVFA